MTEEVAVLTESEQLTALKKQRSQIQSEISQLTNKLGLNNRNHPERKARGPIYYLHNEYQHDSPRITVAGYVDLKKSELHWSLYVCMPGKQFSKKTGRARAMGKAISTKRHILRINRIDHAYVRSILATQLAKVQLDVYQSILKKKTDQAPIRTAALKSSIVSLKKQLNGNGTYKV